MEEYLEPEKRIKAPPQPADGGKGSQRSPAAYSNLLKNGFTVS
jgi:hypothetical protein